MIFLLLKPYCVKIWPSGTFNSTTLKRISRAIGLLKLRICPLSCFYCVCLPLKSLFVIGSKQRSTWYGQNGKGSISFYYTFLLLPTYCRSALTCIHVQNLPQNGVYTVTILISAIFFLYLNETVAVQLDSADAA